MPDTDKLDIPLETPESEDSGLLRELLPRFSPEREKEIYQDSLSAYQSALLDRETWEANLVVWDDQYYGKLPKKDFPWEGASNLPVPLTMLGVETMKPRLIESILGEIPPVLVTATEKADEEQRSRVELFFNWQILTEIDLPRLVPESAHLFLNPGLVVAKPHWKVTHRRRKYLRKFPVGTSTEDMLQATVGAVEWDELSTTGTSPKTSTVFTGKTSSSPNVPPQRITVTFKFTEKFVHALVDREDHEEVPAVEFVDPVDFIVPVRGDGDIKKLPWVCQRLWLTEDELRQRVKLGKFYKEPVAELLGDVAPGEDPTLSAADVQSSRDESEGVDGLGESSVRNQQYPVIEQHIALDVDEDGFTEDVILWWSPDVKEKLLGWDYLDNGYAHGRRPYVIGRFLPIPFRF